MRLLKTAVLKTVWSVLGLIAVLLLTAKALPKKANEPATTVATKTAPTAHAARLR